jgi:hypothetical protein
MSATIIELFPSLSRRRGSREVSEFPAILREIKAAVAAASPEDVFSAGLEAVRIASAFPASGVATEDIRQALIHAAIMRRIPIETSAPIATA